jgi:catechol 2,3-dioxygenase-like lactoylglutathione lyase family enzyme
VFLGLRTVTYSAPDLEAAKAWYTRVLGVEPYFAQPFYVGFNVGGFELGLDPNPDADLHGLGGVVAYWGVANALDAAARLREAGAHELSPLRDVGEGIQVAIFRDPFGNALGIIENPHFQLPRA